MKSDPHRRTFLYHITDQNNKTIYVGQTVDPNDRISKHIGVKSKCTKLREFLTNTKGTTYRLRDHFFLFSTLRNGVPASRSDEFECFLIHEFRTCVSARNGGCNLSPGPNYTDHYHKFDALREEVKTDYVWPTSDAEPIPKSVVEAKATVEVLTELNDIAGDIEDTLSDDLRVACQALEDAEKLSAKPAWKIAKHELTKFAALPPWRLIDRNELDQSINAVKTSLLDEEVVDNDMLALLRAVSLFNNPSRPGVAIGAFTATSLMNTLYGAISDRDDARTTKTVHVKNAERAREWSFGCDGKMPRTCAKARRGEGGAEALTESIIGRWFQHWKNGSKKGDKKVPEKATIDLKMRHTGWYEDAIQPLSEKMARVASSLNSMLRSGVGLASEPFFEGKQRIRSRSTKDSKNSQEYALLRDIICGKVDKESVDAVFEGLDERRKEWYVGEWTKSRGNKLEEYKKKRERRKAERLERKKRKLADKAEEEEEESE